MGCCQSATSATGAGAAAVDTGKRVNFVQGMLLGAEDFVQEQAWHIARRHELAREVLGYGTVRGLRVTIDAGEPRVRVTLGMAWTPSGAPVCVGSEQCCTINDWIANAANKSAVEARIAGLGSPAPLDLHVVLAYRACLVDTVPIPGEPCRDESELTAPSRVADGFSLCLRLDPPDEREELAIRDFADWIAHIALDAGSPPQSEADFLEALRAAAADSSPPRPLDDLMAGSPPAWLETNDDLLRAALRLWVTELRPRRRAPYGCGPGTVAPGDADDAVLLATLHLNVAPSDLRVDVGSIVVDESRRPIMLSLRMLQELIAQNPAPEPGDTVVPETAFGLAAGAGLSAAYARADHTHGTPTLPDLAGDVTGAPSATTVVALRNRAIATATPATGDVLALSGAGVWTPAPLPVPGSALPGDLSYGGAAALGSGTAYARANHVHALPALPPLAGDAAGPIGANRVVALQGAPVGADAPRLDDLLVFAKSDIVGEPPRWRPRSVGLPVPAATAPTLVALGTSSAVGSAAAYARADHRHGAAALPSLGGDVADSITSNRVVALQGVPLDASGPNLGDVLRFDGTSWVAEPATAGGRIETIVAGVLTVHLSVIPSGASVVGSGGMTASAVRLNGLRLRAELVALDIADAAGMFAGFSLIATPVWNERLPLVVHVGDPPKVADSTQVRFTLVLNRLGGDAILDGPHRVHFTLSRYVPVGGP